ncbi:TPA: transketolase [Candidatus Spyradomonas excrementavium]|nr:transketolase [Candidatus Spyradomonas excrementavium]
MNNQLLPSQIEELNKLCREMRKDILSMIHAAKSGHPGGNLSAVEILAVLYKFCMNHSPEWDKSPDFQNRDRFILSKGHASAALYSILAECGYFPKDELLTFRKLGTRLQGHPSCRHLKGIEVSTGSLGQGLSMACGVALGLKLDKNPANVFVLVGDGEMQEGSIWEAIMNASHHNLNNLIAFIDKNKLQIDGCTCEVKSIEPLDEKFEAFGWNVINIDGHNVEEIFDAVQSAKTMDRPTAIIAETVKGKGVSFMENNCGWHGKAPNDEDFAKAMAELA